MFGHASIFTTIGNINNRRGAGACRFAAFFLACVFTIIVDINNACASENDLMTETGTELVDFKNAQVPVVWLDKFSSEKGESQIDFLKRVGAAMQIYSWKKGVETCSAIWTNGTDFKVRVQTAKSHISCLVLTDKITDDSSFKLMSETIHSHPLLHEVVINEQDALIEDGAVLGKKWVLYNATFSPTDKAAGPGFLIANRRLQYFDGTAVKDFGKL